MKLIKRPEAAKIQIDGKAEVITFDDFLVKHVDFYAESAKSVKALREGAKVVDLIEKSDGNITMDEKYYDILKAACETPRYHPLVARQCLSYYDAVEQAEEVK